MDIAFLLFDNVNALDVAGPCEVLSKIPGTAIKYVSKQPGIIKTDIQLEITADYSIKDVEKTDMLIIPGGPGVSVVAEDTEILNWIRNIHETTTWTVSIWTGAILLAIAGILKEVKCTTHWVKLPTLKNFGAKPQKQRFVIDGKVATSAGVSAGIDLALNLTALIAGETTAKAIQLGIEYDPAPPFECGSPSKAPKEISELVLKKIENKNKT
jgi:transcriptional regulator GlxA family with amidase domain